MNLFKLIKAYLRGFVGGPDFTRGINHRFILEGMQLTINLPDSNVVTAPSTLNVNFPHSSTSWFAEHAKVYRQHSFVRIITENWMYMPPIALFPSSEYGMLSCQLRIKQTDKINVLDKVALSHFVTQAYDDYHNGPDGTNTELRRRKVERSSQEEQVATSIELHGRQPLAPAIIKTFNKLIWVFYQEVTNDSLSRLDYYCLPLSEHSFLEVKFNHQVDLSQKHKKWAKAALEAQERIMDSIYLDDLPIAQDPQVEHSSVPS